MTTKTIYVIQGRAIIPGHPSDWMDYPPQATAHIDNTNFYAMWAELELLRSFAEGAVPPGTDHKIRDVTSRLYKAVGAVLEIRLVRRTDEVVEPATVHNPGERK